MMTPNSCSWPCKSTSPFIRVLNGSGFSVLDLSSASR